MATFIVKCFGSVSDCFYGTGEWRPPQPIPASQPIPEVILDTSTMGEFTSAVHFLTFSVNIGVSNPNSESSCIVLLGTFGY